MSWWCPHRRDGRTDRERGIVSSTIGLGAGPVRSVGVRWHGVLAVGIAAVAAFLAAPKGSAWGLLAWSAPFVLPPVVLAARLRNLTRDARRPLVLLCAGQLVYLGASVLWYVGPLRFGVVLPFPSPVDAAFFASYLLYAAFLVVVLRRRPPVDELHGRLGAADTTIFAVVATVVLWAVVIQPALTTGAGPLATAATVLYPALQLVLFALAARLLLVDRLAGGVVSLLLLLWIGGELFADVVYGFRSANGTFAYDAWLIATWMLAHTALAAWLAHPGVDVFLSAAPDRRRPVAPPVASSWRRVVRPLLLLSAALVPLALAAFTHGNDPALMAAAAAMFALSLYRASLLAGDLAVQRWLRAELDRALTTLRTQHAELAALAAVVSATDDAVVTVSPDRVVLDWNGGAERLFGYRADEVVGQPVSMLVPADAVHLTDEGVADATQQGRAWLESVAVRKDGSRVEVQTTLTTLYDEHGEVERIVGISRDVGERNAVQRELTLRGHRLDEAQRIAGVGSWEWDVTTDQLVGSVQMRRMFGVAEDVPMPLQFFLDRAHPADRAAVASTIAAADGQRPLEYETRMISPDGDLRWVAVRAEVTLDEATRAPVRMAGTVQDVTEHVRMSDELTDKVRRLDEAQRLARVGSFEQDLTTGRDVWSTELFRILGVDETTPPTYALFLERMHPDDRPAVERHNRTARPGEPVTYEARAVRSDGEVRWIHVDMEVQACPSGQGRRVSGTVHDVTDQKTAQRELERLALTDSLTGLANRDRFTELLTTALQDSRDRCDVGLLLLDLDGFKDVNDGLGHDAGDQVLQEVARRIAAAVGDAADIARLGGDEFAVVMRRCPDPQEAIALATAVRSALEPVFDLAGMTVHVSASIGIVLSGEDESAGALLKKADVAMYRAKTLASGWAVFAPDEDDLAAGRLAMVTDLRASIEQGTLDVVYQPVLDVHTRRVTSFEALARWHHPERGAIPPDQFIPLAEQADLIIPLTRLVLQKAAAACAAWRAAGHDLKVAVNLSVQAVQNGDPRAMVDGVLAAAGLAPQHLVLEITESALATEGERVEATLLSLRDLGATLVIDDFGTGYSAMSYLKELPVEELKIDRSFVRDIASDTRDLAIVRSLIRLAHSLSLRVVAEGVETVAALEVLTGLGCDFAQGYGIARPMPEGETLDWLARYDAPAPRGSTGEQPVDVLIVDDSRVIRSRLASLAAEAGWRATEAASAEEALVHVSRSLPDVVILDHYMEGMSGMEAVPQLRSRGFDGPILLFTRFLSEAVPSMRVPLDVWPVSKYNPEGVFELLNQYRASVNSRL